VSYFRPQNVRKIATRSVSGLPNSTQNVSRKRGRVIPAKCAHPSCLISRVQSNRNPNAKSESSEAANTMTGKEKIGGRDRDRTGDPLLAKQVLSQLSYTPTEVLY
jgi:hypothetical protein